jgi:phospho-N-acetylmuramoyl-pentapeptide-transferase
MNPIIFLILLSFLMSLFIGKYLIQVLKRNRINQRLSIYLEDAHENKKDTPTMGGLIFIFPTIVLIILLLLLNKVPFSGNLLIVIFTFISYALIGFIDDYLIIKRNNNKGLSESSKIMMQVIIAIVFFYLFMISDNEPLLWIHSLNIRLNIGWLYGLFILFVLVASSNAVNLTDGLDGLAGGLSFIAFIAFGLITLKTTWLDGYYEISLLCFIISGGLLGFLFYNVNPAKIFMGDTGSLSLGATLGSIAILTRHELLLVLIGIVFVIETITCLLQRIYFKLTRKRLFLITPIHHSFEKKGMKEKDIVKLFWTIGLIASMIAISCEVLL